MNCKKEINNRKAKEIAKQISTPEGRIELAESAYELLPIIHSKLVTKRLWQNDRK